MPTLRKRDVKFCPICGGPAIPVPLAQHSSCETCPRIFTVDSPFRNMVPSAEGQTFHKECGKKVKHPDPQSALAHARDLPEIPHRIRARLTVYKCRFGDGQHWHVGHMANRKKTMAQTYFKVVDMLAEEEEKPCPTMISSELSLTRN